MIRRCANGKYYCDGHACGYPLAWFRCDPEEDGAEGEWVCLDCGSSMFAGPPEPPHATNRSLAASIEGRR